LPTYDTLGVPLFIFDKDNATTAGVPATFDKGYGDTHLAGYAKTWELQ
jgi:ribose transport system substrate-binding protein